MKHRERALAAMRRQPSDGVAVQYYYTDVGAFEHGEKLNQFFAAHPGDFAPFTRLEQPQLSMEMLDAEGHYYEQKIDEWGILWEYLIVGRMGHAIGFPVKEPEDYDHFTFPPPPDFVTDAGAYECTRREVEEQKREYVYFGNSGYAYLERLTAIRGFEDTMCDLYEFGPESEGFFEQLTDYYLQSIKKWVAMGVDAVAFGDDYGTQQSLLISPELFRRTIMPYLDRLMRPIREAGIHIHFHSCGMVQALLPLFGELGVNSVWPQLPAYDMRALAEECHARKMAVAIHTDRAVTMTHGTPEDVRAMVWLENEIFRPQEHGGWFYVEEDNGFPYENVVALVEEIYSLRH
jgi:hypothetical protein